LAKLSKKPGKVFDGANNKSGGGPVQFVKDGEVDEIKKKVKRD